MSVSLSNNSFCFGGQAIDGFDNAWSQFVDLKRLKAECQTLFDRHLADDEKVG